ncbi:hypothetical protein CISIN_1g038666mg [Citrus sinensis]|uniref:Uncharacterized protein n=1 Tax=Citrus sinensis TaxID=2711 RepID=A0A067EQP1_CITSI|nr:hypothetical protein CISIN_1g038666mg [Citrus sinensis]
MPKTDPASYPSRVIPGPQRPDTVSQSGSYPVHNAKVRSESGPNGYFYHLYLGITLSNRIESQRVIAY